MTDYTTNNSWQSGEKKMEWVQSYMPVLTSIRDRFIEEKPFTGLRITMSIHLEAKQLIWLQCSEAGGHRSALRAVTPCQPRMM